MNAFNDVILSSVSALERGGILLYPTDTIWGVGCDATNSDAVEKIYLIKRRDHTKSMLILCSDIAMVESYVGRVGEAAKSLLIDSGRPTTVILPVEGEGLACNLIASDGTIGIRVPRMDYCQRLLHDFGRPIVSTSANFSGDPSPSSFEDIDSALVNAVDFAVPRIYESSTQTGSSRIVKLTSDAKIIVIRP
ncbi:MAG: threonylcarbamoyl-AMP synthase [Bacteroidales bacterium]|nr:threonylcarbamoyl-AMP synthase [Bacteroidales bacterium]